MKSAQACACSTTVMAGIALALSGCATELPPLVDEAQVASNVVVGRVVIVITGERTRLYRPEVRSFEVEEQQTQERFNVEINSEDRFFLIALSPGDYRITR